MSQIAVPDSIAAAALGGDTSVLGEVQAAYAALKDAQQRANSAFQPEIAQVLADGLARSEATNGEAATMTILEDGSVVVLLGDDAVETVAPAAVPAPTPAPKPTNGGVKYPGISELRKRAAACGADISEIAPQNKKAILEAIEAAEAAPEAQPEPEPVVVEAAAEPEAAPEPEPEPEPEDESLGLDDSPDEEPVESPENEENVPAVEPAPEVDVDSWLDD